jgi:ACR3 family arsenite efflux pump ArsB
MSFFERYLTIWVLLCIGVGIALGKFAPEVAHALDSMAITVNEAPVVSVPIAVCLFMMMYPIMVKIDFHEVVKAGKAARPVGLTMFINWAIKPFTMYAIASFFLGTIFLRRRCIRRRAGRARRRHENARSAAVAQLSRGLHPSWHRTLYGHGSRLGLPVER